MGCGTLCHFRRNIANSGANLGRVLKVSSQNVFGDCESTKPEVCLDAILENSRKFSRTVSGSCFVLSGPLDFCGWCLTMNYRVARFSGRMLNDGHVLLRLLQADILRYGQPMVPTGGQRTYSSQTIPSS